MSSDPSGPSKNRAASRDALDVVVVGSGLVGMAAALAASQAGMAVGLIAGTRFPADLSKSPEPWDRRVYAISPKTQSFLDHLRVWGQLDAKRISPVREMRVQGDELGTAEVTFGAYEASADALAWIVEHRELARVLEAALGYQQNLEVLRTDAEGFLADSAAVSVTSARATLRGSLLVAADGASSKIRDLAGVAVVRHSYEETAVVANFQAGAPHRSVAWQWFTDEGVIALLPLPGDCFSLVWSAPTRFAKKLLELSPDELAQRVTDIAGPRLGGLHALGGSSGFALELLKTRRQIDKRLALVGDAAHVIHPLAGQGLNLGMQDVETLMRVLGERESFRDCGDPTLLRRFERARREPLVAMRHATHGLHELFSSLDPRVRQLRSTGMKLVERLPVLKRALMRHAMG